jgi:hypothetical protein
MDFFMYINESFHSSSRSKGRKLDSNVSAINSYGRLPLIYDVAYLVDS